MTITNRILTINWISYVFFVIEKIPFCSTAKTSNAIIRTQKLHNQNQNKNEIEGKEHDFISNNKLEKPRIRNIKPKSRCAKLEKQWLSISIFPFVIKLFTFFAFFSLLYVEQVYSKQNLIFLGNNCFIHSFSVS